MPDHVSVVSFDDSDLATWLRPALTGVAVPFYEMGMLAVDTLLLEESTSGTQLVHMPLRERGPVSSPPG